MKYRIFIVEDDETIANLLKKHLSSWGYDVFLAEDFSNILQEFAWKDPHLVLLDLKLPFYNGFHWCEEIRKVSQVPVIFISSAADNMNMVMAMSRGADDFIAKPFDMLALMVRMEKVLKRWGKWDEIYHFRDLTLDRANRRLTRQGEEILLPPLEFDVLAVLMKNKNRTVSRDRILNEIWGEDYFGDIRTVDVRIANLRKKLNLSEEIRTISKAGYRLEER